MRVAAILGPGVSAKTLESFQKSSDATWLTSLPADSPDADVVLIFGGDGTVHRHLGQLVKLHLPVLVVPCGSGNDFASALSLRSLRDSIAVWRKFVAGGKNIRTIDLGVILPLFPDQVHAGGAPPPHGHYFCSVGGLGLDAETARRANQLPRWLRSHGGYALSLPRALMRFAAVPVSISVPEPETPDKFVTRSNQPTLLAAFANAPAYGGGMRIAPRAKLDDGLLDVCVVSDINRFKLFCLFPTIYFGRHLGIPKVEYFQTDRLRLESEKPLDVYADGEFVCQTPIEVRVARVALRVIVPSSSASF
jgi:diacylglycerol kinase (ATP)